MPRYIDADTLIVHLKDEIEGCKPPFCGRANGKSIAYGTILGLKSAISFAETLSTADVAPKSEVDLYKRQVDELEDELATTYDKLEKAEAEVKVLIENSISVKYPCCVLVDNGVICTKSLEDYDKLIGDISSFEEHKKEVAREIFEEIEREMMISRACAKRGITYSPSIAELKKKYTEVSDEV